MPEGHYTARVTVVDGQDNMSTTSTPIAVSHQRLVTKTYQRTVPAARAMTASRVGECSTLRRPSLRRWAGSLGYYSSTRCNGGTRPRGTVTTVQQLAVPKAFEGRYGNVRLQAYGGAAVGHRGSRLGYAFLRASDGARVGAATFGPRLLTHTSPAVSASSLVHTRATTPFIRWQASTTGGHRYDVKNAAVRLSYVVLE